MIKFEKVSKEEFVKAYKSTFGDEVSVNDIEEMYDAIQLPQRATQGSAGYDIKTPISFLLEEPNADILIPTGIRAIMPSDTCLIILPRSGLGFKHYLRLANTVALIDSDYSDSDNEGHIFIKVRLENHLKQRLYVKAGERIAQGVFMPYFITDDDISVGSRNGGMGSTGA